MRHWILRGLIVVLGALVLATAAACGGGGGGDSGSTTPSNQWDAGTWDNSEWGA